MDVTSILGKNAYSPLFTTRQLLACVPGLTFQSLNQRILRKILVLPERTAPGRGRKRLYNPTDVVQTAVVDELFRQGYSTRQVMLVWKVTVWPRVIAREFPLPNYARMVALLARHPTDDDVVMRTMFEGRGDDSGFDHPDAPDFVMVFQVDRFIDRVAARMVAVLAERPVPTDPDPTAPDIEANVRTKDVVA